MKSSLASTSRALALGSVLLLPMTSACGGDATGPSQELTQSQLIAVAEAVFRHTVVTSLDLPREQNSASGTEVVQDCAGAGNVSTTAFITGTGEAGATVADLRYQTGTTYDGCVVGIGSTALEINTTANATGLIGDIFYQRFGNGEIEIEGFLLGRFEIEVDTRMLNCDVAYQVVGESDGVGEDPEINYAVAGDVCGNAFAFNLVVAGA